MKSLYKSNIALMVIFVLFFTGCEKWIDTDMNINPDVPSDVPMNLLVPTMELSMSYQIGGIRAVKTTNIYMQFINGVARQSYGESNYIMSATDVDDLWRRMYYQPMMDAKKLMEKAGAQNSPHYAGVAKVCMALCLGTMTNFFGDIPYSEAFLGDQAVLKPDYDSQEEIYNTIMALLDEVNMLAEQSPGFVWRMQGESGNSTDVRVGDDPLLIVNLTVWESADDLFTFTYRSDHRFVFARRLEWFKRWEGPSVVLWWQP
ncbi:MAG: DUF3291 domain-containing protein, partial [Bacteroidales bacterium]|nr:DUF3291 domain-containing protein [Bacteroidales bacterium]